MGTEEKGELRNTSELEKQTQQFWVLGLLNFNFFVLLDISPNAPE